MDESVQRHLELPQTTDWRLTLLEAADIMERDGWVQGCLESKDGVCLIGAIIKAAGGSTEQWHPECALATFVYNIAFRIHPAMAQWNDNPFRTKAEVITRMRAVALGG